MKRAAAISMAALLTVGGATAVLTSTAGAQTAPSTTSTSVDPMTPTTQTPEVVVTNFSITLAGLGDINLSVDPTTREISNIVVTPLDGITVADPTAVHNGIQLDFTLADGTVRSIVVEVEGHHGQVRLEIEDETDDVFENESEDEIDDHDDDRPRALDERGRSAEHRNDDNGHRGQGRGVTTPPSTAPATTSTIPSASESRSTTRSESSEDRQESESESGSNRRSGSRD